MRERNPGISARSKNNNYHKFRGVSKFDQLELTSLDISDVDTVWTWGDKLPPPISKYFKYQILSEIFLQAI